MKLDYAIEYLKNKDPYIKKVDIKYTSFLVPNSPAYTLQIKDSLLNQTYDLEVWSSGAKTYIDVETEYYDIQPIDSVCFRIHQIALILKDGLLETLKNDPKYRVRIVTGSQKQQLIEFSPILMQFSHFNIDFSSENYHFIGKRFAVSILFEILFLTVVLFVLFYNVFKFVYILQNTDSFFSFSFLFSFHITSFIVLGASLGVYQIIIKMFQSFMDWKNYRILKKGKTL